MSGSQWGEKAWNVIKSHQHYGRNISGSSFTFPWKYHRSFSRHNPLSSDIWSLLFWLFGLERSDMLQTTAVIIISTCYCCKLNHWFFSCLFLEFLGMYRVPKLRIKQIAFISHSFQWCLWKFSQMCVIMYEWIRPSRDHSMHKNFSTFSDKYTVHKHKVCWSLFTWFLKLVQ